MDSSKAKKLAEKIVAIEPCGKSKTGKLYNVLLTGGKKTGGMVVGKGMHTEREALGVAGLSSWT